MTINELKDIIKVKTEKQGDGVIKVSAGVIFHVCRYVPNDVLACDFDNWLTRYKQAAKDELIFRLDGLLRGIDNLNVESYYKEDK